MKPEDRVLDNLGNVRRVGAGWCASCPCPEHGRGRGDVNPSLSINLDGGGNVLLKCHAGCANVRVVEALNLKMSDLFARPGHEGGKAPSTTTHQGTAQPCTLQAYADLKQLPMSFLEELGLADVHYAGRPAVRISYLADDGTETAVRFRIGLKKTEGGVNDRFRWRRGDTVMLYGLWRLRDAREAGHVFLVEGESDCHALWFHGLPALGVPGASNWRGEWSELLEGVQKAYAVVEPDGGGEAFWERLAASPVREKLYRVQLDGAKDVSEARLQAPEVFVERIAWAREQAVAWLDLAESEAQETAREAWSACEHLALAPDILALFTAEIGRRVAGESRTAKLLYLALTSRLLEGPVSVAVKGPSSGGKTYLTEQVLSFFPEDAYYALTAMSEKAMAYSEEPIKHRFLVLFEAEGMAGDFATYLIRSLLSEGRLRYEFVEKTREGLQVRLIEREGPTGLIVTTTAVRMHPENETRLLSLTVADTQEQTRDVLDALAEEEREGVDPAPWHALQMWLSGPAASRRVTIPYAKTLARMVPPVAVRLRRDFGAVLNLIRAHAVLHQASRERDFRGRVVATLDDYDAVRALVADLVSDGIEATVPEGVREAVEAVIRLHDDEDGEPITVAAVARELGLDRSAASRRVRAARERGHLRDLEHNPRKPSRLVPGEPLPENLQVLPDREALEACGRAAENGETNAPLSAVSPPPVEGGGSDASGPDARSHAQDEQGFPDDDGRVRFTL